VAAAAEVVVVFQTMVGAVAVGIILGVGVGAILPTCAIPVPGKLTICGPLDVGNGEGTDCINAHRDGDAVLEELG
jgi:hypothetical protein